MSAKRLEIKSMLGSTKIVLKTQGKDFRGKSLAERSQSGVNKDLHKGKKMGMDSALKACL